MHIFNSEDLFRANMGTDFSSPYEAMYMNSPGWNMNSAYMSPSYMGNFRPSYGGERGFSSTNIPEFSALGSYKAALGMDEGPYYTNPAAFRDRAFTQIGSSIPDAAMTFGQHIAMPLAGLGIGLAASRISAPSFVPIPPATSIYNAAVGNIGGGMGIGMDWMRRNVTGTMSPVDYADSILDRRREMAAAATRQSIGGGIGAMAGNVAGRGFGAMAGGAVGGTMGLMGRMAGLGTTISGGAVSGAGIMGGMSAGVGAAAGSLAGSFLFPYLVGSAAVEAGQQMIVDPYISARRGEIAAEAAYGGMYTGTSPHDTRGISRQAAARLSQGLMQSSGDDRSFGLEGHVNIFDMAAQEGLLADTGNFDTDRIVERVKSISVQVQALMSIAGDPDVNRAVKKLAEFKRMGISGEDFHTSIQALGAAEAISGTSAYQIQNTVGRQASYMFQQAGIGPQGAMSMAATSMAGFSNAYQMGLINPSTMAAMGGVEGATQSFVGGQIGMARSLYNQIGLANRFMGGKDTSGDMLGTIATFGTSAAANPLAMQGALALNSQAMIGAQLAENPMAPLGALMEQVENGNIPRSIMYNQDGTLNFGAVAGFLQQSGVSTDQIRSILEMQRNLQDEGAGFRMDNASTAQAREQHASTLSRRGLSYTQYGALGAVGRPFHNVGLSYDRARADMASDFGAIREDFGAGMDSVASIFIRSQFGDPNYGGVLGDDYFQNLTRGEGGSLTRFTANPGSGLSLGSSVGSYSMRRNKSRIANRVAASLNRGIVTEEQLDEAFSLSDVERTERFQSMFGLEAQDAALLSHIGREGLGLESSSEVIGDDLARGLSRASAGLRASSSVNVTSSRMVNRFLRQGLTVPRMIGSKLLQDEGKFKGLDEGQRLVHLGVVNALATGTAELESMILKYKDGDTRTAREFRKAVKNIVGIDVGEMSVYEIREHLDSLDDGSLQEMRDLLASEEGTIRSLAVSAGENLEGAFTEKGRADIYRRAKQAQEAQHRTGQAAFVSTAAAEKEIQSRMQGIVDQRAIYENMKGTLGTDISFEGYLEMENATKMDRAASNFSEAVDRFVEGIGGSPSQKNLSEPGDMTFFPNPFRSNNRIQAD